jgi:hypothetical protein
MGIRTDQWIGLTHDAESFVADLPRINSGLTVEGTFGSIYNLGRWQWGDHILTETIQTVPWSSGPMYFTCLEILWHGNLDLDGTDRLFVWVANPDIKDEVDYKKGHYWV